MTKDDRSPVTVADFAAQAVIAAQLSARLGDIKLVGEEDAHALRADDAAQLRQAVADAAHRAWPDAAVDDVLDAIDLGNHDASAASFWTLDPIDGTKGFLRGGQYAISLAFIERGEVKLGVLGCPNLSLDFARAFDDPDPRGCVFYAYRGGGAHCFSADDRPAAAQAISAMASGRVQDIRMCESVEAGHSRRDDTARVVAHLGAAGTPARLDSQCKYAVVARGQADLYLRMPTRPDYIERIWDHAAGMIVAEEAGAVVTDITARALDFSHGAGLEANRGIVCAADTYHAAVMAAIDTLAIVPT